MEERSVHTQEPDRARAREIAHEGMVLRALVGSTVHGLANPGTDDRDEMGVCVDARRSANAMHALRIGVQGIELLETGRITLPVPEPHRARLRAVRSGAVTLTEVVAELEETAGRLRELSATANLPPQADADRIDTFLVDAYRRAWALRPR